MWLGYEGPVSVPWQRVCEASGTAVGDGSGEVGYVWVSSEDGPRPCPKTYVSDYDRWGPGPGLEEEEVMSCQLVEALLLY